MWDEYELTISSSKELIKEDEQINIKQVEREANKIRKEIGELKSNGRQ